MTRWIARTLLLVALCAGGAAAGSWWFRRLPVEYCGHVRLSIPYEVTRGTDPAQLPLLAVPGSTIVDPTAEWLVATIDLARQRGVTFEPEGPFGSELDTLRTRLITRHEKQAGQDDYVVTFRSAGADEVRTLLTAASETGMSAFRKMYETRLAEVTAPLRADLAEREQKIATLEAAATATRSEIAQSSINDATRASAGERARLLSTASAEARKLRLEAENRFVQARTDLEQGKPIESIVARLPDGALLTSLTTALHGSQSAADRQRLQDDLARMTPVWGNKHPRIVEMKKRLAEISAASTVETKGPVVAPRELLLATLEADWREKQRNEEDLTEQLVVEEEGLRAFDSIHKRLAETERELGSARAQFATARERLESESARHADEAPRISEGPFVSDLPTTWTHQHWLLAGAGAGTALAVLLLSLFCGRTVTRAAETTSEPARPSTQSSGSGLLAVRRRERLSRLQQLQSGTGWSQPVPAR